MEVWKDIEGYEGKYQVSNFGNVKSLNYHRGNEERLLVPCEDSYGYLHVLLYKNGKRKTCKVHRLVADTFLNNDMCLPSINHKDENKHNNAAENLEFCSVEYNNKYSKEVQVLQCDLFGNVIRNWNSVKEASVSTRIKSTNIVACCRGRGRVKTAGGYVWRYSF